jgi:hypothetical protein
MPRTALPLARVTATVAAVVVASTAAAPAAAQRMPASQRAGTYQSIGFTDVRVEYGRPTARGRALFPGVVRWDRVWNPGADSATHVTFARDVRVEGRELRAGAYSVWLVPRESAPWTVILSRAARVFHVPYPGEAQDALRVDVTPERGAHMEALAIYFPVVAGDSAVMRVHWGETIVPLRITAPYRPR